MEKSILHTLKRRKQTKGLFLHLYVHHTPQVSLRKIENLDLIFVHSNTTRDTLQSSHCLVL